MYIRPGQVFSDEMDTTLTVFANKLSKHAAKFENYGIVIVLLTVALHFQAQTSSGSTVRTSSITMGQTPSWKEAREKVMQLIIQIIKISATYKL